MAHWNCRKKISDYKNYIARPLQNSFFTKILLLRWPTNYICHFIVLVEFCRGLNRWLNTDHQFFLVDLRRVELRSAQGNHTLSTCLFQPLVFEHWQDLNHQPMLYPLNFIWAARHTQTISDLTCTAFPSDSEQHLWSSVSFNYLIVE